MIRRIAVGARHFSTGNRQDERSVRRLNAEMDNVFAGDSEIGAVLRKVLQNRGGKPNRANQAVCYEWPTRPPPNRAMRLQKPPSLRRLRNREKGG
jgi:hypothetical protein